MARRKHVCDLCSATFPTGTAYDRHQASAHGTMSFRGTGRSRTTCGQCNHISLTRAEANAHRKSHGLEPHKRVRKDKRSSEQKAVAFFYKNAGSSYTPGKETRAQGKRRGAQALARAEAEASARGWEVEWEEDDYGERAENGGPMYVAILKDEHGNVLGSLGGIDDDTDPYRRVVEAELALEALG